MNIGVHVSLLILVSSVCMPSSGIAGSYGSSICSRCFLKEGNRALDGTELLTFGCIRQTPRSTMCFIYLSFIHLPTCLSQKMKVKSLSHVRLFATPWTVAYQASQALGFSRQECWSGLPFPSPGDRPNPGTEPGLLHCRQTCYHLSYQGSQYYQSGVSKSPTGADIEGNRRREIREN